MLVDIQVLRAVAVISVVVHHLFPELFPHGGKGVDLFFVISGYVITLSLLNKKGDFWSRLLDFAYRRVARLAPAATVTALITLLILHLFWVDPEPTMYWTGVSSLLSGANIQLWLSELDYGSPDTQINPFTHFWSLSLEGQFYLVFAPAILWLLLSRKNPRVLLLGVVMLSLVSLGLWAIDPNSNFGFYSLPTRAWQFLAGMLVALTTRKLLLSRSRLLTAGLPLAWAVIPVLLFASLPLGKTLPVILVVSAMWILLSQPEQAMARPLFLAQAKRFLAAIGDMSYSVYLWHWPMLVSYKTFFGDLTFLGTGLYLLLLATMSFCSWKILEQESRRRLLSVSRPLIFSIAVLVIPAAIGLLFLGARSFSSPPNILGVKGIEFSASDSCSGRLSGDLAMARISRCLGPPDKKPEIFLIGDSHALSLLEPIKHALRERAPSLKFSSTTNGEGSFPLAEISAATPSNESALLAKRIGPGDALIVNFHAGRLNFARDEPVGVDEFEKENRKVSNFQAGFSRLLEKANDIEVKVYLVLDNPLLNSKVGPEACVFQSKILGSNNCEVTAKQHALNIHNQLSAFCYFAEMYRNVRVVDTSPVYFSGEVFDVVDKTGAYTMADQHHLSQKQAKKVAELIVAAIDADKNGLKQSNYDCKVSSEGIGR